MMLEQTDYYGWAQTMPHGNDSRISSKQHQWMRDWDDLTPIMTLQPMYLPCAPHTHSGTSAYVIWWYDSTRPSGRIASGATNVKH